MNITKKNTVRMWTTLSVLLILSSFTNSQDTDSVLALLKLFDQDAKFYKNNNESIVNLLPEYDFIIVGAGSAGCVLANRLSEISKWNILLIEAGGEENIIMDIPIDSPFLQFTSSNWNYKTEPSDKYCSGFENKQCLWAKGKVLGGTSVLNDMIYTRGSSYDYDNWETMGNTGWGWKDVLRYFKKMENFNIPYQFDSEYHGKNGNMQVETSPFQSEVGINWIQAAQELGFTYVDYNGATPSGVSYFQLNMINGTRYSSNKAYLNPAKVRPNLHIMTNTLVTRLVLDNTTVIGVELENNNKNYTIFTKKEVVISAGAIRSPQLLMLSGIGPKDNLQSLNISVVKDLPVGENLMDHIATGGICFEVNMTTTYNTSNYLDVVSKWFDNRNSSLSLAGGNEALIFMNREDKFNTTLQPDVEIAFAPATPISALQKQYGFTNNTMIEYFGSLTNFYSTAAFLLNPKSRGKILLQSRDPKMQPKIIPNYLAYEEDMQTLIDGIKTSIEISEQPSMVKVGTKFYNVPVEECLKEGDFGTDAYFACQTRLFTFSTYHHSGTCKMGTESDATAVVSPKLIIHGLKNARVIDASIMPEIVRAHTNAPTYMIAEKGADLIKQDWGVVLNI